MSVSLRIGIIGGVGWLGGAIAGSILYAGLVEPRNLSLSYRSEQPRRFPNSFLTIDIESMPVIRTDGEKDHVRTVGKRLIVGGQE
ncbi:hypothetical protein ACC754_38565, partial [Rhizobium johnstonii]